MWLPQPKRVITVNCFLARPLADELKITAKHLEPLKNGKIPVEILVTTKDPESKSKAFEKCLEVIKSAGVS